MRFYAANCFRETGLLVLGARDDPHFDGVVKSFEENPDAKYQLHDPIQLSEHYPNLTMGSETWGCYDPVAGVLMADKALKTVWVSYIFKVTKNNPFELKFDISSLGNFSKGRGSNHG